MRTSFDAIDRASIAAMLAAAQPGPRVIENRGQALPKGALKAAQGSRTDRRASAKAAAAELVGMSNQTLVVAHLHPRWLRELVNAAMDAGQAVTMADVDRWRAQGETLGRIGLKLIREEKANG